MPSQLFKEPIPLEILFDFLSKVCEKEHSYYKFNSDAYKRANLDDTLSLFLEKIKPYYHIAKRKYVDRKQTYSNFVTILRQLCNNQNVGYTSKIFYSKSKYEIIYYINPQSQLQTAL